MNNKIISKSERSTTNSIIVFIGIILFSFFIYLLDNNFQPTNEYEVENKTFGFCFLAAIILYCVYYFLNQKRVYVYEKHFEIRNLFQTKKYYYTDIISRYSEDFKGKYNSWTEYYLILNTEKKVTLIDSEYSNFYEFYSRIKEKIKKNHIVNTKFDKKTYSKYAIICVVISVTMFFFSSFFYDFKQLENSDFAYITTELKGEIKKIEGSNFRRNKKEYIEFQLTQYPKYTFVLSGVSYRSVFYQSQLLEEFAADEKITIGISKEAYDKKIANVKPLNFIDKHMNLYVIDVKQIKDKSNNYLINLEELNQINKQNNYLGIGFFTFIGLLFLFLAFGNYRATKK